MLLENDMKQKMFLTAAALVLLFLMGQRIFAQFDPPLELLWEVPNIGEPFEEFAVSPDETIFVATHQNDSTATIRIYDMTNGALLRQFPAPFCGRKMAFMPDSRHLAITGNSCSPNEIRKNGKIKIMDLQTGIFTDSLDFPDTLQNRSGIDISVSPNNRFISTAVYDSRNSFLNSNYVVYNTSDHSIFTRLYVQNGSPYISTFSPDSKYFFFNEYIENQGPYILKMLNIETKEVKTIHIADNPITDIKFSDDSKKMLFAREKDILGIYNLEEQKLDTIILEPKYDYVGRNAEFINDNFILLTTGLGFGVLNRSNNQITIVSSTRIGLKKLFHDNNTFFYASEYWAGKVTGLDKIITGVKPEGNNEILYPNPVSNTITVKLQGIILPHQIQISDLSGKNIKLTPDKIMIQKDELQINVSGINTGTYLLTIQNSTGLKTFKFIVGR